jgi:radical SAM superfamily enzyme YgiQ (UPF0313 family)
MRIMLIAPAIEELRVTGDRRSSHKVFRFSVLSLLTVAACTDESHEVTIVDEQVEPIDFDQDVDLVGISFMTAHAPRAYEIAAEFRRRGVKTVAGGYHPTFLPQEAARHFDAVVAGEAEPSWPNLLRDASSGSLQQVYRATDFVDLATLRQPPRHLLRRNGYITVNTVQTGRGCPNGCRFCSITRFFNRTHRQRPVDDVIEEVGALKDRFVLFIDDNITADPDYARCLFRRLRPLGKNWVSQSSITVADDPQLVRLAAESGCVGLFVGLETVSTASLAEANKSFNRVEEYRAAVRLLHDHGIGVESGIVFGFDHDTVDVFERTLATIDRLELDAIQASIFTPLPGTALFQEMDATGRILDRNWRHYDFRHVVFQPRRMAPEQLQQGADWVIREFYSLPRVARRLARNVRDLGLRPTLLMTLPVNLGYRQRVKQWNIRGALPSHFKSPGAEPRRRPTRADELRPSRPIAS